MSLANGTANTSFLLRHPASGGSTSESHPEKDLASPNRSGNRSHLDSKSKSESAETSSLQTQKPKIWSVVADVMSTSSSTSSTESREKSDERSPAAPHLPPRFHLGHHPQVNGHALPHPAFPTPGGAPTALGGVARGVGGLWSPSAVTSLSGLPAGYPYPTGAGSLLSPAGQHVAISSAGMGPLGGARPPYGPGSIAGHPGLISAPGLSLPHGKPTDLRKPSTTLGMSASNGEYQIIKSFFSVLIILPYII